MVITIDTLDGHEVEKNLGTWTGSHLCNMTCVRCYNDTIIENIFQSARENAREELFMKARSLGGDAIFGLHMEEKTLTSRTTLITATGVILKLKESTAEPSCQKN